MTTVKNEPRPPWWWKPWGVVSVLVGLGFWAALIWVAWHFISKYW
jgi:hypothetical protein